MTKTHPSSALLAAYVAGRCSDGAALAVAAHATYCPNCRAEIARLEAVAGAILSATAEAEATEGALDAVMSRLDEPAAGPAASWSAASAAAAASAAGETDQGPLPRALLGALGCAYDDIPWKLRLPGVAEHEIMSSEAETVSLLRVRPGAAIPRHTHKAEELTLVMDGELIDGGHRYGRGDIAAADASVDHHPKAGGDRPCVCLAVLSGGLTFTGPIGRALNLFT